MKPTDYTDLHRLTRIFNPPSTHSASQRLCVINFLILLFLLSALSLHAQTAAEIDTMLETEVLNIAQTARFVLGAANLIPLNISGNEAESAAYELAVSKGWITKNAQSNATLQDTAFLIMNAFEIRGGLMYRLFSNQRYAFRELIYLKLIEGRAYPEMTVSGQRLLQIITRALTHTGDTE